MKKIIIIVAVVIGLGMVNGTGILFPSEVKACGSGGSSGGHNYESNDYQGRLASPPPEAYGYYGNHHSYNQVPQGDGPTIYGGGTGYYRGPETDGTQGHQNH